jgi:GNAT superfamily N-acetyltransferase
MSDQARTSPRVTSNAWQIRPAVAAETPDLARLRYAFRSEYRPATEPETSFVQRCTTWMARRFGPEARWRCWVAVADERLVATLWLQLIEKLPNPGDETEVHGYITSVYVLPEFRKGGIASALLTTCLDECDALGVDAVFLWSTPESRELYLRHGFASHDDFLDRR